MCHYDVRNKKAPLTGGGVGAGQRSLPYEKIIGRKPCKFVTEFSTISTKNNPRSAPSIAVGLVGGVARANLDLVAQYIV